MPSTRDFKKSIDLTGLSDVSGSEMNQLIDVGRAYDDKGLVIVTTDTALNIPDTPNPNLADGMGITPTWWKNYIWIRKPFNNTSVVKVYVWNDLIPDAGTLLKWVYQNQTSEDALAAANGAQITANEAKTDADAANTALAVLDNRVTNTETDIDNLQTNEILQDTNITEINTKIDNHTIQTDWSNILSKPAYYGSRYKLYNSPVDLITVFTAAPFALTAWTEIALIARLADFGITEAYNQIIAIISTSLSAYHITNTADELSAQVHVNGDTLAANNRIINFTISKLGGALTTQLVKKETTLMLVPLSITKSINYRWASDLSSNTVYMQLQGFILGVDTI